VVEKNERWTMVVNQDQAFLGRCFFALARHETDVTRLSQTERDSLWEYFGRAKAALDELFKPDHYNYVFLMNVTPHLHAHIIPRYAGTRDFAGETFTDGRLGDHYDTQASHVLSEEAYDDLVTALRLAMT
jgi:diadenosine tetraphosphate (Ap4A) HIT family hydrolase